ncbi:unknown [Cercopithecine alphaherpesvirus 9]|uniref:Uncharacterized protein n=1 Tax=Cercopithecine herpesvirus 9 (strain DHV) TaxID=36348 RepID=Q9E1Y6_CHV9D|nr:DNA packaging terminase subunit 2 [Cercopithecine alphaherpesvirus 9]AAG27204.1 unknown [Cercopithecine alphaherpesvirus 9]
MEVHINRVMMVLLGQLKTYTFQMELLRRCDPRIACRFISSLTINCLTVRYIIKHLQPGLIKQTSGKLTPLIYSLVVTLKYLQYEAEALLELLINFNGNLISCVDEDIKTYFVSAFGLNNHCPYHHMVYLKTYGENINTEIQFLHDVENFLKQLNYCYIITSAENALTTLCDMEPFLVKTIGSGFITPLEIFDHTHPCSVCFEELCITANQGEVLHRRLLGCICDHVTKQMRINVDVNDILTCVPYVTNTSHEKRNSAVKALRALKNKQMHYTEKSRESHQKIAADILDAHSVFKPAPRCMYALSELQFWLTSSSREHSTQRTLDAFVNNLDALGESEKNAELMAITTELALFENTPLHFNRAFSTELGSLNAIDSILVGNCYLSPDSQINALIQACYNHHMSSSLMQHLVNPSQDNEVALRQLLEQLECSNENTAGTDGTILDEHSQVNELASEVYGWEQLIAQSRSNADVRKRAYLERLSKRSLISLGKCVKEQRKELEKTLRVNVYGETLLYTFVTVYNAFSARRLFLSLLNESGTIIDNRISETAFDSHMFVRNALIKSTVDAAMLPSLTHKFFELVNGPIFCHDEHCFAQPPNTALFFTVENVGLFPHLKEELAKFMGAVVGSNWTVSTFRSFYSFHGVEGVTTAQRLAWRYIRELVFASALFTSVFHCGEVALRRIDRFDNNLREFQNYNITCKPKGSLDGIYITYEEQCPLIAVLHSSIAGTITKDTIVIYDADVFSLLYTLIQRLVPDVQKHT